MNNHIDNKTNIQSYIFEINEKMKNLKVIKRNKIIKRIIIFR